MFTYKRFDDPDEHAFAPRTLPWQPDLLQEVKDWCREHFDEAWHIESSAMSEPLGGRWSFFSGTFLIRDDDDAFAFRMRWC